MNEFNIRKELPSIKVDIDLIKQLEKYILSDVPEILGIDPDQVYKNYSLEIIDSLGSGQFNRISEFPLSILQDGTDKIKFGFKLFDKAYYSVNISFSKSNNSSKLDISLKTNNPREKAQGIYNGIFDRINPHKTYNYIFHTVFMMFSGGLGLGLIGPILIFITNSNYLWASLLSIASILIMFFAIQGQKFKPYSEFMTKRQSRYNRIFSFFIWGVISYMVFGLGLGIIKELVMR